MNQRQHLRNMPGANTPHAATAVASPHQATQRIAVAKRLEQSFVQDLSHVETLQQNLDGERAAFEQGRPESIPTYTENKEKLVAKLDQQQRERCELLSSVGLASDPVSWENSLVQLEQASGIQLRQRWESLAVKLQNCEEKLLVNEKIVAGIQSSVARFLNILRGQTNTGQTYDASGKAHQLSDMRPITRA